MDEKINKMKTFSSQEIISRLKIAIKANTDNEVSSYLGISKATLSNWKKRNSCDFLLLFSKCKHINLNWLIYGEGSMLKIEHTHTNDISLAETIIRDKSTKNAQPKQIKKQISISKNKGIPLIPLDAIVGFPADESGSVYFEDCERYIIPEFESKGADYLIRVSGDSMMPLYYSGDLLACRKIHDIRFFQWGTVYVLETSQGVLVKRVQECDEHDDCILCVSENSAIHKPFILPRNDIRSLSTIIGLVRLV